MSEMYKRIEELCKARGISVNAMCKQAGVGQGTLGDLKAGNTKSLSPGTANKIASFFNVSPAYLLYGEEKVLPFKASELFHGVGGLADGVRDDLLPNTDEYAIYDTPLVIRVARAGKKMSPEQQAKALSILAAAFPEEFADDN